MLDRVYDKTYPGGLHLVHGKVTNALGVSLDEPPGAPPVGETGASDDAKAAAEAAEAERAEVWAARQQADDAAQYGDVIATALATTVADLDAFLATVSDPAAIEAMAAADERVTATAHYATRLGELAPVEPSAPVPGGPSGATPPGAGAGGAAHGPARVG